MHTQKRIQTNKKKIAEKIRGKKGKQQKRKNILKALSVCVPALSYAAELLLASVPQQATPRFHFMILGKAREGNRQLPWASFMRFLTTKPHCSLVELMEAI